MENELRYQVRSREIVDLYTAMHTSRLTLKPYFQRNLVWRDTHKRDFIDTILKGYPFPQIFLARGPINLETMEAEQCVVDGQQRLNTIRDFITGKLAAHDGKYFPDFTPREREAFLKYEVAVIDFDLDAGDTRLKDVFYRLNRTYYSLSAIEKIATEYSASEFLLVGRVLCGEITTNDEEDELLEDDMSDSDDQQANMFDRDPGINTETWEWLLAHQDGHYAQIITDRNVFTPFEFDRKVPLMFTLNVMCTYLAGYFNRNDRVRKYLEDRNDEFPERDEVIQKINDAAQYIRALELPEGSMWFSKANFFSLLCEVARGRNSILSDNGLVKDRLVTFSKSVRPDYSLAAREAVGRKNQRELRARVIRELITLP